MVKVHALHTGKFKLDGGAMFGVVPKSMWNKLNPSDENNMCTWSLSCLLVQDGDRNILIDTGIGNKQDEKFRSHFYPHETFDFDTLLSEIGLSVDDITDVLLTHLHFDHCGGVLYKNDKGEILPTFPNAKVWSNDYHFQWASQPNDREKASFLKENIQPLKSLNILHLIDVEPGIRFSDNITLDFVYGHTGGMMIPYIQLDNGKQIVFTADLLPSHCHVSMPYVMAYDIQPLLTLNEKHVLYEKTVNENTFIFLEHDKDFELINLVKNEQGRVIVGKDWKVSEVYGVIS